MQIVNLLIAMETRPLEKLVIEFFHNSRLIRRIKQKEIFQKIRDLSRNWTHITCLAVRHLNHYTKLFSVLVWDCNSIILMGWWFCPICLIHLIWRKSLHFGKNIEFFMSLFVLSTVTKVKHSWTSTHARERKGDFEMILPRNFNCTLK